MNIKEFKKGIIFGWSKWYYKVLNIKYTSDKWITVVTYKTYKVKNVEVFERGYNKPEFERVVSEFRKLSKLEVALKGLK